MQAGSLKDIPWFLIRTLASPSQRRHLRRWFQSLRPGFLLEHPSPWLTFDAIDFLAQRLQPGMRVFEYGSGGSTLFWLKSGAQVVSVEHNPAWYEQVQQRLKPADPIDYRLILPEGPIRQSGPAGPADPADPADPDGYFSGDRSFQGYTFHAYVTQIDAFADEHFDLVLVDGRARPACIKHSLRKIRPRGMIVVDNTERAYYLARTEAYLAGFRRTTFRGALPVAPRFVSTTILTRWT